MYILALRIYFTFYVYNFCLNYEMLQFSSLVEEFPRMLVSAPLVILKFEIVHGHLYVSPNFN